jgi:hypothetical protein
MEEQHLQVQITVEVVVVQVADQADLPLQGLQALVA